MNTPEEIAAAWNWQRRWNNDDELRDNDSICLLDLLNRVEALEHQTAPQPAPAVDEEALWNVMMMAWARAEYLLPSMGYAAEIDAVAAWLAARNQQQAANMLRAEARRARGEA